MGAGQAKLRAVFDTNIVISAIVFKRNLAWLRGVWANGRVIPVVCHKTVVELINVLTYAEFRLSAERQEDLLQDYLPYAETVELPAPLSALPAACRDADDDLFLHLALFAKVDGLVTGDGDLLALAGTVGVPVKSIQDWRAGLP